jgi:hypothetical protein
MMELTVENIAEVVHEAIRGYQRVLGEVVSHPWENTSHEMRWSTIEGVQSALMGSTPEQQHDQWRKTREQQGWRWGEVKDFAAKTHPCMVAYDELPEEQRIKDHLVIAISMELGRLL